MNAARAPFRYRVYGLTVASDIELPALQPGPDGRAADIRVVRRSISAELVGPCDPMTFANRGAEQILAWSMVGAFRIVSDAEIEVDANPGVADSLVALPLLGAVFATLLQRRGLFVLHASAVSVSGRAVALLGDKGAGKSTTAGALLAAGHQLIADDVVAVDFADPTVPDVLPAFAQLKLWDDSGAMLQGRTLRRIGPLHERIDKAGYALDGVPDGPVPLTRLYVLSRSQSPGVGAIAAPEAMRLLLANSYMGRFGEAGFGAGLPTHFARAAAMIRAGLVRSLTVPEGLERIDKIPALIATDMALDHEKIRLDALPL